MIYTVTLNPALDRALWVKKIKSDDSNRIEREERFAAGKGIDVSKVLTALGVRNIALGFIGGFSGEELAGRLLNEGITCDFVSISGETRTNIIVNDMTTGTQVLYSDRGPQIKPYELMQFIHKLEIFSTDDIIVISGSLPPGVNPEVYYKIIEMSKSRGARILLDADGHALRTGISALPDAIKPNIHELSRLVDRELKEIDDIINAAESICQRGVKIVLVSMGAKGILLVNEKQCYLASPPEVEVKNTIGAGDSAVAGFIYGFVQGKPLKEALTYAVAGGTATTMKDGTALCTIKDFQALVPKVTVQELSRQ